jgi:hypothetical protein
METYRDPDQLLMRVVKRKFHGGSGTDHGHVPEDELLKM